MNPLIEAARASLTNGGMMGVMTILFMLFFFGMILWAWSPRNRAHMEDASRMPFDDQELRRIGGGQESGGVS